MTSIGFLPKVRLCLCLVLSTLLGSCNLFHDTTQNASEMHTLSKATITLYSPGNGEGSLINAIGIVHFINYPEIDWVPFHQPQVIAIQLWVHNRQELDHLVNQLMSNGIVIKGISYNQ